MMLKKEYRTCFNGRLLLPFVLLLACLQCKKDDPPIVPACTGASLGIYSETATERLRPDIDSYIGTYSGSGAIFNPSGFVDDNVDVKEGGISKRATMTVNGASGQFAGWYVQWGTVGTPDANARDMTAFTGGVLTFWVKSTINLEIGIRSGNVAPGNETSKIILSNYSPFRADSTWYKVSIPVSDFAGSAPKADLSRIKVLFNVASNTPSGGTGGIAKTFWIDDVRWECR
jgi:hypothetical protein